MSKYIENLNAYITQMKIKQTYICMKTGIDQKKMSRLLKGVQDVSSTDMEIIAEALGKNVGFFLGDTMLIPDSNNFSSGKIAFYAGNPTKKQEEAADKLFEMMENIDVILSAKARFHGLSEEG